MATLSNVNPRDPNEENEEKNVSGPNSSEISGSSAPQSNPQGPATGGVQQGTPASGRFTNIGQYMKANKQAGTNLGQQVGKNVNQAVDKSTTAANQSQQGLQSGLQAGQQELGKIQDYTTKLGQKQQAPTEAPKNGLLSQQSGPAYLASGYQANLGNRANYAQQLAGDENQLNQFLNYRSGNVAADQAKNLQQQQEQAQSATNRAEQTFTDKQKQVGMANNRGELLSDVAKSRTYGGGQQSLDNAFLQMDKGNTLANLKKSLQTQQQQFAGANQLPKLSEQLGTLKTGLTDSTKALQDQTNQNLQDLGTDVSSRQQAINDARSQRLKDLESQFKTLQEGGEISQEFADQLGLTSGQTVYNVLGDQTTNPSVSAYLDTAGLQAMPMSQADLANQADVDLYSTFARLAQTNPAITQASALGAEGKALPEFAKRIAEGKQAAQDYANRFAGQHSSNSTTAVPAEFWYDPNSMMNLIEQNNFGKDTTLDQLLAAGGTNMGNILGGGTAGQNRDVQTPFGKFRFTGTSSAGGDDEKFVRDTYNQLLQDMANQGVLNQVRVGKGNK